MSERTLSVEDPGLLCTVQDLGRPGLAHLGVPRSGAADALALRLANRLVGNEEGAAGLELTATGGTFVLEGAGSIAVTGASCSVDVDGRPVGWGTAVALPPGARLRVGPARDGLRSYLAVAGGVVIPAELGSRSTDLLSGLGPPAIAAGSRLPLGLVSGEPSGSEAVPMPRDGVVRFVLGPRDDWFTDASVAALDGAAYVVRPESNRIGLRLDGPVLERREPGRELPSEPMVLGAVQVPPNGRPVVFLADHPTTGGYPVIGVVVAADLAVCAQARPGDALRFRLVRPVRP